MANNDNPNQQEPIQFAQVTEDKKVEKSKLPKVALFAGIILVSVAAGYGLSYLIPQGSEAKTAASKRAVCNADIINEYNTITNVGVKSEEERLAMNAKIKGLSDKVKTLDGYDSDPTCVFINYLDAVNDQSAEQAGLATTKVEDLASRGFFVDTRLNSVSSLTQMKGTVRGLSLPQDGSEERG